MEQYTITLTADECKQLATTLMSRIEFDIKEMQDKAAKERNYKKVALLQNILEINKAILDKIPTKALKEL